MKKGEIYLMENDFVPVVVYSEIDEEVALVLPMFRWTEKAGPSDLFIPNEFFGTSYVVSFELMFSLKKEQLTNPSDKGFNKKQMEYLRQAYLEDESDTEESKFTWGWPYLDEFDVRYKYHEELAEKIHPLQRPLFEELYEGDEMGEPITHDEYKDIEDEFDKNRGR